MGIADRLAPCLGGTAAEPALAGPGARVLPAAPPALPCVSERRWDVAWDLVKNSAALGINDSFGCHVELLRQFAFADMPRAAHAVLERMKRRGMRPSHDCFSLVIAAHARMWNKAAIVRLVAESQEVMAPSAEPHLRWYGRLTAGLLVAGRVDDALGMVREFRRGNSINAWAAAGGDASERGLLGTENPMRKASALAALEVSDKAGKAVLGGRNSSDQDWLGRSTTPAGGAPAVASGTSAVAASDDGGLGTAAPAAPPVPPHAPLSEEHAMADGAALAELGTVQMVRLSMCCEVIGDVLNAVLLELRPRASNAASGGAVFADRDTVPVSELAELVADLPLAPRMSQHERRHQERVAVAHLVEDLISAASDAASASAAASRAGEQASGHDDDQLPFSLEDALAGAPHEAEVLALAQHATITEDGPLAAAMLCSPSMVATLWRAAGLGDAPPGLPADAAAGVVQPQPGAVVREALLARRCQAQRLLETLMSVAARSASDVWRGSTPDTVWPLARHGSARLFDALDTAGVVPSPPGLLLVMMMAREDYERRGGDGLWLATRAALLAEAQGAVVSRTAEVAALAEDIAAAGVSEAGLRPRFAPTRAALMQWWKQSETTGELRPTVAVGPSGDRVVWYPAVLEKLSVLEAMEAGTAQLSPLARVEEAEEAAAEQRRALLASAGEEGSLEELEECEASSSEAGFDSGFALARRMVFALTTPAQAKASNSAVMVRATRRRAAQAAIAASRGERSRRAAGEAAVAAGASVSKDWEAETGPAAGLAARRRAHDAALANVKRPAAPGGWSTLGASEPDVVLARALLVGDPADQAGAGDGGADEWQSPSHAVAAAASRVTALQLATAPVAGWWAQLREHLAPLLGSSAEPASEVGAGSPDMALCAEQGVAWEAAGGVPLSTLAAPSGALSPDTCGVLRSAPALPRDVAAEGQAHALYCLADELMRPPEAAALAADESARRGAEFAEWCSSNAAVSSLPAVLARTRTDGSFDLRGIDLVIPEEGAGQALREPENWRSRAPHALKLREAGRESASVQMSPQRTTRRWVDDVLGIATPARDRRERA